jgi:hypothetical protein
MTKDSLLNTALFLVLKPLSPGGDGESVGGRKFTSGSQMKLSPGTIVELPVSRVIAHQWQRRGDVVAVENTEIPTYARKFMTEAAETPSSA